jgi:hypothetical protein
MNEYFYPTLTYDYIDGYNGKSNGYGFKLDGGVIKTYDDSIWKRIEDGFVDAGNIFGRIFGGASGQFSKSLGEAVGVPPFLVPSVILLVGGGSAVLLIYLLIKK